MVLRPFLDLGTVETGYISTTYRKKIQEAITRSNNYPTEFCILPAILRERFTQDADVNILLAGCAEPDLKDPRLMEKYGAPTPAEAVKKLLLPGEIVDLSNAVEQLTGYRRKTISEVKNG